VDLESQEPGSKSQDGLLVSVEVDNEVKQEAVSALTMLGFAAAASGKVVDKILKDEPNASVEQVIKKALKML
jgi:Holliday junction DNA helicase RuvA